jgi:predicted PurR-regulated permease PerM
MWYRTDFFKYASAFLLILTIIFLLGQLHFFFAPLFKFVSVLASPILVAGLFYYLLRPLIRIAEENRVSRSLAIGILFVIGITVFVFIVIYIGTFIQSQAHQLITDLPQIIHSGETRVQEILHSKIFGFNLTGSVGKQFTAPIQKGLPFLTDHILQVISALTGIATVFVLVPFILFYFLNEDFRFVKAFLGRVPEAYRHEVLHTLKEIDRTLSAYIIGQVVLSLVLGVLLFIGYLLIGIPYSLILAVFGFITAFIPIFGPIIGVVPALLIGFTENPWSALKILILAIVVHLLESNLIAPHLIGKKLKIHPLTIIFLFLAATSLFGFIGALLAVPVYAVAKIILRSLFRIYQIRKAGRFI